MNTTETPSRRPHERMVGAHDESDRLEFEAWKKSRTGGLYLSRNNAPGSDLEGYEDAFVQSQWEAWKAARSTDGLDAGSVAPSAKRYRIIWPHNHKTLRAGDVVVMTQTPRLENMLLREPDMTLHVLQDDSDQYVHMVEASNDQAHPSAPGGRVKRNQKEQ